MSAAVVGRDEELAEIRAFLARIEVGPSALVLSGEPGIGKTILWETGVDEGRRLLGNALVGRGSEAEASLSFAGLSDLLAPVFDEVAASLLPPRRRALEIALLRVEPDAEPPDPHAIGLAVLDALSALAERGPVLVALDDMQWLDRASAGVIQIALRRLRKERVGLLATLRTGPELTSPFELNRSFTEGQIEQLMIGPLSLGTVHALLKERLDLELTRPELARVQEATAGNPFFALEVGRELVRTGTRPAPGKALPVPESLRELLGGRLARLPAETRGRHASGCVTRPADGRRGVGGPRRPRPRPPGTRSSRPGRRGHPGRVSDPLRAPVARVHLLRAGASVEAPSRPSGTRRSSLGHRRTGTPPSAGRRGSGRSRRGGAG